MATHTRTEIYVHSLDQFTETELNALEHYCDSLPLTKAYLNKGNPEPAYDDVERVTQFASIPQDPSIEWFHQRLARFVQGANAHSFNFDLQGLSETPQFLVYHDFENGHFGWHFDTGTLPPRKLSVTIQLTDPSQYEGGQLEFNIGATTLCAPKHRGAAVAFPSYMIHRVTPVTSGTRKVIVAWVTGPAFR